MPSVLGPGEATQRRSTQRARSTGGGGGHAHAAVTSSQTSRRYAGSESARTPTQPDWQSQQAARWIVQSLSSLQRATACRERSTSAQRCAWQVAIKRGSGSA